MKRTPSAAAGGPVEKRIVTVRDQKVILDLDLAELYGVPTKALNQAVKRNSSRFPEDFLFQLSEDEMADLNRSQIVTGSQKHRNQRILEILDSPKREMGFHIKEDSVPYRTKRRTTATGARGRGLAADLREQPGSNRRRLK